MGEDYADPNGNGMPPYGNNELTETNVLTIAQLKTKYANVISSSSIEEVKEDIQIKGYVTGNDVTGNIYNQIALQDETGAIIISINQGGLYGPLPVGQQLLVSLKGLMIGGYGMQPQIGSVYTNSNTGAQSIGRMNEYTWSTHYKLIGTADATKIAPTVFNTSKLSDANYLAENCGKLMTIKNVKLKDANGKAVFAPSDGSITLTANAANRAFTGLSANSIVLRTSTYADFANMPMPTDNVDITGIFTRYRNTWQILLRSTDDITKAVVDLSGTKSDPYTVAEALEIINAGTYTSNDVYVKGVISKIEDVSTQYHNATYSISADGKTTNEIKVFRGKYLDGADFTTGNEIAVGDKVTILGKLTMYNGTPEINQNNQIVSIAH